MSFNVMNVIEKAFVVVMVKVHIFDLMVILLSVRRQSSEKDHFDAI